MRTPLFAAARHPRAIRLLCTVLLVSCSAGYVCSQPAQPPMTRSGKPVDPAAVENLNRMNDARVKRGQQPLSAPGYTYIPPEQRQANAAAAPVAAAPASGATAAAATTATSATTGTTAATARVATPPAMATAPRELRLVDLVNRPEFWPAQCTLKTSMKFGGGASFAAGQKVKVDGIKANEIELSSLDGKVQFAAEPQETDVLEAANREYAALTPAQRELTYTSLINRKELWPYRVRVLQAFDLGRGLRTVPGDPVVMMKLEREKMTVLLEKANTTFEVVPQATDLLAQVRSFVAGGTVPSRVGAELEGKLVSSVSGKPTAINDKPSPRYYVFYRGSSTCSITRQFTPSLVKFYNAAKKEHPEFEIIYIMTESPADTGAFARQQGFAWPAVEYETTGRMPVAGSPFGSLLPQLVVMDATGNILANGVQGTAPAALQRLEGLLNQSTRPAKL